jgi:hypothetical protein
MCNGQRRANARKLQNLPDRPGLQTELFSAEGWRKIAYTLTQATLEAYEGIKKRQEGAVVTETSADILPSQFIVQNARKTAPDAGSEITWQTLYEVWEKECERRKSTKDAYLAAMTLFAEFSRKAPAETTREDALAFRDFLRDIKALTPGTIANKLGFIGTLFNAGRNTARLASQLPENPFGDITVKRAKRGNADKKRLTAASLEHSMEMGVVLDGRAAVGVAEVVDAVLAAATPWV